MNRSGEVVAVGEGVEELVPGDRVFAHHHAPCFRCELCDRGEFVQCTAWREGRLIPGGMAEYFVVPAGNVRGDTLRLPDGVSYADASLIEPVACTVKSIRRAGLSGGERIAIVGLGIMGQLHVLLARDGGAGQIIGLDRVPFRLERARELGADAVIHVDEGDPVAAVRDATGGALADVVIVGPGSIEAMELGLELAGRGATVVLFTASRPEDRLAVRPYDLYFREIRLVPSYSCGPPRYARRARFGTPRRRQRGEGRHPPLSARGSLGGVPYRGRWRRRAEDDRHVSLTPEGGAAPRPRRRLRATAAAPSAAPTKKAAIPKDAALFDLHSSGAALFPHVLHEDRFRLLCRSFGTASRIFHTSCGSLGA